MAKYKVLKPFIDAYTDEKYKENQVIQLSVKRAKEIEKNLSRYSDDFLERLEEKVQEEAE